ncbi:MULTISPECIES: DUF3889 domain-containing protein [Bacillus]|uniref:DUF3889 domain-containing protein n=1 Tax=Bacillus TaxID=1386 RepID=UPI00044C71BE|nr:MULTISPECIES: DUF3889 domain-containing protein [Bacillus]MBL3615545.1 YqzG/YhdC family protein [Bacillus sp. RHFS18]AJK64665.1 hypothetical protein KHU1_0696 [Bacillus amyloliquefaciens KHG19]AKL75545.1 hypothetical protein ABH13_0943 [Bacillus velezensis]AMQ70478.1 hypothetical protein BAMY6639_16140 [Bacillus amyloliquefaciens UMAF6639]ANB83092.1 hypothetical protein A6R78_03450 [Bacillus velezensis]
MKSLPFVLALLFCGILIASIAEKGHTEHLDPSVEKWEQLAWNQLEREYKGAELTDYSYMGRTKVNREQTKDVFRVTVQTAKETFSSRAEVYFHPVTKHVISINIFRL